MKVQTLQAGPAAGDDFLGTVLCQTVTEGPTSKEVALTKERRIGAEDLAALRSVERQAVRVIRLQEGDVHEDEAAVRLVAALAGPGVRPRGPSQSRIDLVATERGVLILDVAGLTALNAIPDVAVFTALPHQPVEAGEVVAGAKVIPVVVEAATVGAAERIGQERGPLVQVRPVRPRPVGVVVAERADGGARDRFEVALRRKLAWFGAPLVAARYVHADSEAIGQALREVIALGAEVLITAGSRSADPVDPVVVAVQELGGTVVTRGAPTHPGSFFWLGYLGERAVFGVPTCGLYARATIVDLLLPRVMAGECLTRAAIAELGVGGLLGVTTQSRFPRYDDPTYPSPTVPMVSPAATI